MQLISDLKPMRLYSAKRKVYLPFNPANKKKGATIKLLTRDMQDSIDMINLPYLYNPKLYRSYYMSRNVMAYIDSKGIVDHDAEEKEDEVITEAIIHKASKSSVTIDTRGTPNDKMELQRIFSKKAFDKWFKRLGHEGYKYNVTVYGFNSRVDMVKAINTEVIMKYSDVVFNSYCTPTEIFVLNQSAFSEIKNQEIDYEMYCNSELIAWVCMTCSKKCNRVLANYIGAGMSGQAKKIRDTKWDKQEKISSDIGPALLVTSLYNDQGDKGLKKLVRSGDITMLAHYKAENLVGFAKVLLNRGANKVYDHFVDEGTALNESDGSHEDAVRIFQAMNDKERNFITHDEYRYEYTPEGNYIYRHIEKGEGILDMKGYIEIAKEAYSLENYGDTGSVIIGVHPAYRREGVGKTLVKTMLKELPNEHPEITNLIWRADINNKPSQRLAEKCGFTLIRKTNVQCTYRYSLKKVPYIEKLDTEVTDLNKVKKKAKEFKITSHVDKDATITPIETIIRRKSGNELDRARYVAAYLNRMAMFNIIIFTEMTDKYGATELYFSNAIIMKGKLYMVDPFIDMDDVSNMSSAIMQFINFAKSGKLPRESDEYVVEAKVHYFIPNSILRLEGKPFFSEEMKNYLDEELGVTTPTAQEQVKENAIQHIPLPRVNVHDTRGDDGFYSNPNYLMSENTICFFNEDEILQEANSAYDARIRRYIYKERIRTNKELVEQYNRAKELDPRIDRTYLKLEMYRGLNLFVDYSYYNGLFLSRMNLIKDKGVAFYWDFMNRLFEGSKEMKSKYNTHTVFIPVSNEAWDVPPGGNLWDYRHSINPISVFMRMVKTNPTELRAKWKNMRFVFLGKKGYFTVDFNKFEYKNVGRLKVFINRLTSGEDIDEEEDGYESNTHTDTKNAIGMSIIEKIEKSSGITIDNVSKLVSNGAESLGNVSIDSIPTMRIRDTKIYVNPKQTNNTSREQKDSVGIAVFSPDGREILDNFIDLGYVGTVIELK